MTESEMQQPTETIPMFPKDDAGAGSPSSGQNVHALRSMDPLNSLDDYNRTMLEYTHRQMSSFVDVDDSNGASLSGISSRSSQSSGNIGRSGSSNNGVLARQANGPPPTSAGAAAARRASQQSRTSSEARANQ